jgi:hypothetical protein
MRPGGLRRTSWAALAGLVGGTAITAVVAAAPARADIAVNEMFPRPSSGVFTLQGHGWGHGRGMSQYGAQGAATIGKTADEITSTYYPGTTKQVIANTGIRIQLRDQDDSAEPSVFNTTVIAIDSVHKNSDGTPWKATGLFATDLATGTKLTLDTTRTRWQVRIGSDGKLHLYGLSGSTYVERIAGKGYTGPIQFMRSPDPVNAVIRVQFPSGHSRDYRYAVQAVKRTTSLNTLAYMPMESYLRGVVPRESSSSWLPAALQAQAIAARSYAGYLRVYNRAQGLPYDLCNTTACQVFGGTARDGVRQEAASTDDAVAKSANVVRWYGGKPIFAEFSSSNGGWSTTGDFPYLVAKADPWDGITGSSVHSWDAKLPVSALESRYSPKDSGGNPLWRFVRLTIKQRDGNGEWGGRVLSATGAVSVGFVEKADATKAHSVDASGSGIVSSYQWPRHSDGLRSRWFRVVPEYSSSLVSRSAAPKLVLPPGWPKGTVTAVFKNTGNASWPLSGLHLALASPAGGADPLVGGSTRPGAYVKNLTHPGATSVIPNDQAQFSIPFDATDLSPGTRTASYRLRIGTASLFGATATWTVVIDAPQYTAAAEGPPSLLGSTYSAPPDSPALWADKRTVVVPRNGSTTLRLTARNTGNFSWATGPTTPIQLGTSGPRGRASDSASSSWLAPNRVSRLVAPASVPAGGTGTFDLQLAGNSKPTGVTTESFEPIFYGRSWISGAVTTLDVVRIEPRVGRAALPELAPATGFTLANAPTGTRWLVIRLRNVGGESWTVGTEQLGTPSSWALANYWASRTRTPPLRSNVTRPGATTVAPGEVGEWRVQVSAYRNAPGTYTTSLRAVGPDGFYGPSFPLSVKVVNASFTYEYVAKSPSVDVPSSGSAWTWVDIRNTSNFVWPVGGVLRSTVRAGSSPSYASSWFSASRPGSLSGNMTSPGLSYVRAGEVARFRILLAGNGRPLQSRTEAFGMSYDGWRSSPLSVSLSYRVV